MQFRLLIKQQIKLNPNPIASMIRRQTLDTLHDRRKAVGQIQQLLLQNAGSGLAG